MVVAHPADESRPLGFGTKLAMTRGDRVSIVETEAVDPTFRAIVNSGELNRISAKVRLPGQLITEYGSARYKLKQDAIAEKIPMEHIEEAADLPINLTTRATTLVMRRLALRLE